MKLFAVLDIKSGFFLKPFAESSTVQALRGFDIAVNESDSTFRRFPDDFALMELAEFDSQNGQLQAHAAPVNLGTGRSVLRNPEQQLSLASGSPKHEIRN